MARTALFGVLGPFVGAALAAVGCEATVIYIETAAGTTTITTTNSTTTSASGGAGGALLCAPGATQPCYSGPAGTEGQGICTAGAEVCAADGMSWGACSGEVLPAVEDCATAEDEDCDGLAPPCKGELLWAKRFGDIGDQRVTSVATDASGNVLITGSFAAAINFGGEPLISAGGFPGSSDVFVAKLDSSGNHVWSKRFGDAAAQIGWGIIMGPSGDVLVTGAFSGAIDFGGAPIVSTGTEDVFIAKLDSNGAHVWSKSFGVTALQKRPAMAVDGSGNVFLAGSFSGSVDFGGGPLTSAGSEDVYIVKLGAAGEHVWSMRAGDDESQAVTSLAVDGSGDLVVVGSFGGSLDLGGGALPSAVGISGFVAKLDAAGNHVWSKSFGVAGDFSLQHPTSVAVGDDGEPVMTGYFSGSIDLGSGPLKTNAYSSFFLAKLDSAGHPVWGKSFGDAGDQSAESVALDLFGNVVLTGYFHGQVDFGGGPIAEAGDGDVFVTKFDAGGGHLWGKRFGDGHGQAGRSVASGASGDVLIIGDFGGTVDFGGGPLGPAGGLDVFVARFSP